MIATRGATAFYGIEGYQMRELTASVQFVADPDRACASAWAALIDELLALRGREDDWDGQGAKAPHPALVDSAIRLAQRLHADRELPADRVVAGVNGSIYFEWFSPTGYAEIEVLAPNRADGSVVPKGSDKAKVFPLADWSAV